METLHAFIAALIVAGVLLAHGVIEKRRNERNIRSIPIRINVNGIRGKSTATRLITAVFEEAGYKTIGKTTGTSARMIYWGKEEEKAITRRPFGVSLTEQVRVIDEAASLGAEALVCECMAVRPEYQKVYQHQMVKANLTVIVNVLEDHLDEMGPTTTEIARAFADTIPYDGMVVIPDCKFTEFFKKTARRRNTKVFVTNDAEITEEFLSRFDYKLFDHNCAVALAAARAFGIPDDVAYRGMLKAHPDPGALRIQKIRDGAVLVNAFAANEPSSSLAIWDVVKESGYRCQDPIVVMNCRPDRVDRTEQFVRDFFPEIKNATLVIIGEGTTCCRKAYEAGKFPDAADFRCFEGDDINPIMEYLEGVMAGRVILGVGNIHGIGGAFLEALTEEKEPALAESADGKIRDIRSARRKMA